MQHKVIDMQNVVIRFAGDSGGGIAHGYSVCGCVRLYGNEISVSGLSSNPCLRVLYQEFRFQVHIGSGVSTR